MSNKELFELSFPEGVETALNWAGLNWTVCVWLYHIIFEDVLNPLRGCKISISRMY